MKHCKGFCVGGICESDLLVFWRKGLLLRPDRGDLAGQGRRVEEVDEAVSTRPADVSGSPRPDEPPAPASPRSPARATPP